MFVVLDTNIFYRDFLLRGNAFRILLESIQYVPARLCIPEVVLDETLTKYAEALRERLDADAQAQRRLREILVQSPAGEPRVIDGREALATYEAHLRGRLRDAKAKLLPYPTDPHKEIVKRALLRSKPFDEKGRGYCDYLIWASLRTEMYYSPQEAVVLVTSNTHDFCDGDTLAASLQEDLKRGHPGARVSVVSSLEAFNKAYVLPKLQRREELRAALQAGTGGPLDLHAWAVAELPGLLRDEEYLIAATHGLELKHARVYATAIDSIDDGLTPLSWTPTIAAASAGRSPRWGGSTPTTAPSSGPRR